jgi:hypothetical protein
VIQRLRQKRVGRIAAIIVAVGCCVFSPPNSEAAAKDGEIKIWTLANGEQIQASVVAYSRQSKILTLELPNGAWVHIAPRDLNGASKLQWLFSDPFIQSLSGYSMPGKARMALLRTFGAIGAGAVLALFLAFWISVTFIKGNKSLRRALLTFLKITAVTLGVIVLGWGVHWGLDSLASQTVMADFVTSAILGVSLALVLFLACRFVGHDYGSSTWDGITTLGLMTLLFAIGSLVMFIGLPRLLNQPGIDEWLTEQVLTPMELA